MGSRECSGIPFHVQGQNSDRWSKQAESQGRESGSRTMGGWVPHPSPGPSPEQWKRREASRCRTERAVCPSLPASPLSCRTLALFSWEAAVPGHSRSAWPSLGQGFFTSLCSTTKRLYRQSFKIIEEILHLMTLRADIR